MDKTLPISDDCRPAVLVAEDDPDQSDILCEFLTEAGFHVEPAHSGDAAIKMLSHCVYDLIIMDNHMPGRSGASVLRALRQHTSPTQLPVIVVTSFAADDDVERFRSLGANECMSKPYRMHELVTLALELIRGKMEVGVSVKREIH